MDKINLPDELKKSLLTSFKVEDFDGTSHVFNETEADDNATVALDADGLDGRILLSVATDDNEEAYIYTNELFKFASRKPFSVYGRFQYAEAATDDANVVFGVIEGGGTANTLLDDGGGPPADYDGACIFKVDGGTRWNFETSDGATQKTTELDATAGGSNFVTMGIDFCPLDSGEIEVTPWIDSAGGNNLQQCREYDANPRVPYVKHTRTFAGTGEMALVFGIKNGGANSEVLTVDLAAWASRRS